MRLRFEAPIANDRPATIVSDKIITIANDKKG